MLAANQQILWIPAHLKDGRFGNWLEAAREWAISRNRYWGNPIPIWRCQNCGELVCLGSRKELEQKSGRKVADLHKHFVDDFTFACTECKGTMRRIPEVLDCWFESGAMPYAQSHYPFENRRHLEQHFPADFIAEGLDQTRGWFYTLTVLAAGLFDKPAFKNVVVNGLVLAEDGKKMSKSEKNFTDPRQVVEAHGADALRLFLMYSAVVKAEDLRFSEDGVKEVLKNVIIPLWNAYSFFVTYANIDGIVAQAAPQNPVNPLDRWILSEAARMVAEASEQLDCYDLQKAIDPLLRFIDLLNNWYIRRSRRRFWRSTNDLDKHQAYATLYAVLMKLVLVAAPFVPFITEEIYRNLRGAAMPESVHLCDFPLASREERELELEQKMAVTRRAVSMGRSLRTNLSIKIRQPLMAIHLVTRNEQEKKILREMEDIIKDELNLKSVVHSDNEEQLVEYEARANYRRLGKLLGKDMKAAAARIEQLSGAEIQSLLGGATLAQDVGMRSFELTLEGVDIRRNEKQHLKVLNEGSLTVALDTELTEELVQEGRVRDLVRSVQNLRKNMGLEVTDRIELTIYGSEQVRRAIETHQEHLTAETLAVSWRWQKVAGAVEAECGDQSCLIELKKVEQGA